MERELRRRSVQGFGVHKVDTSSLPGPQALWAAESTLRAQFFVGAAGGS